MNMHSYDSVLSIIYVYFSFPTIYIILLNFELFTIIIIIYFFYNKMKTRKKSNQNHLIYIKKNS